MSANTIVAARRKRIKPRQHSGTSGFIVRRLDNIAIHSNKEFIDQLTVQQEQLE
jgi:hypothetical protein